MSSERPIVAISTSSFGSAGSEPLDALEEAGFATRLNPYGRKLTESEAVEFVAGITGLIAGTEPLTRRVLGAATGLKAISRCGTGDDNVDHDAAAECGIVVRKTSEAHVDAVAELALGGLLAVLRGIPISDRSIRDGGWTRPMGRLLSGRVVGLIGFGRVGRRFAELLAPFGVRILATDPVVTDFGEGVESVTLEELLRRSQVVSLHLPLSEDTRHLLNAERIATMRSDAVLVNCARGGIVDERALSEALAEGKLGGAFLDVFESEPYGGVMRSLDTTALTAHIGSYAAECRLAMEVEAVENLLETLA